MEEISQSETSHLSSLEEEKAQEAQEAPEGGKDAPMTMGDEHNPPDRVDSNEVVEQSPSYSEDKQEEDNLDDIELPEETPKENEVEGKQETEFDKHKGDVEKQPDLDTQEGPDNKSEDRPDLTEERPDEEEEEESILEEEEERHKSEKELDNPEKERDNVEEELRLLEKEAEAKVDQEKQDNPEEVEDKPEKEDDKLEVEENKPEEEEDITEEGEDKTEEEEDKAEIEKDKPEEEENKQEEELDKAKEQDKPRKKEDEVKNPAVEESSENPRNEMQEEDDVEIHPDKKDESKESDESKKSTNEEKVTDLEKLEKEDDNSETRKDTKTGEDPNETVFEEVDANVSDEKEGNADESDMLGDSDMTVPEDNEDGKDVLDDAATDADKATPMEVDCLSSNDDVEMVSPADNEPSDPKEKEGISEEHVESALEVEKSPSNQNEDEPMEGEPEETPTDTPAEGGEDVVDTTDDKQTQEAIEIPDVTEEEKQKLDSEKASDKDAETISELRCDDEAEVDDDDGNQRSQIEDDDAAAPSNDTDVIEVESESNDLTEVADSSTNREDDANIENVQEPEESDVCLIPDTDTEMTEDEKERAIQARENAEKEGELAEEAAEAAAKNPESAPEEAPQEPEQEPLLEEMQAPVPATTGGPTPHKTIIFLAVSAPNTCAHCKEEKVCGYRFKEADKTTTEHLCEISCVDQYLAANPGKYFLRRKKFLVEEVPEAGNDVEHECLQCKNTISRNKYFFKQDDVTFYICSEDCYKVLSSDEPEKFNLKRDSIRVRNIGHTTISSKGSNSSDSNRIVSRSAAEAEAAKLERTTSFLRRCVDCQSHIRVIPNDKSLVWQAMDFCHELCLGKYQRRIGSNCQTCKGEVPHQSLGKYCVRFGFEVRQFCCATCLNNFKKGLKTCSCCQKDISGSGEGFLAPVGDKEQFKDFCSQTCMRRYDAMCNAKKKLRTDHCGVCNFEKQMRVEMTIDGNEHNFCSNPCFSAFKFVSNIVPDQCAMCSKYFERKSGECFTIYGDKQRPKVFCSRICFNVYIIVNRQITSCQWCKVKKYDFDMIMKIVDQRQIMMCSLNCLTLYGVSLNAFSRASVKCDNCNSCVTPQYHLTMSDASMRNFCTYQCVMQFQSQFARVPLTLDSEAVAAATHHVKQKAAAAAVSTPVAPFPTGLPKRVKLNVSQPQNAGQVSTATGTETNINIVNSQNSGLLSVMPVISNVASLAPGQNERLGQSSLLKRGVGPRGRGRAKKIMNERPARIPSPPPVPPITRTRSTSSPILAPASASQPIVSNKSTRGGRTSSRTTGTHTPSESPRPPSPIIEKQIETKIVTVPPYPPLVRNVQTSCHPKTDDASVDCRPETAEIGIQTDEDFSSKILIPVPVPIFVPQPMYMYSAPFPVPVPIPLPIPVPIFIPTTRNSSSGILKEIKKIQDKMPADPFEAELLMMAEMVADEKNESDSDSEEDMKPEPRMIQVQYESPTAGQTNNVVVNIEPQNNSSFGEDVLQMALKMASGDYEEPGVDLESAMTTNTITNPPPGMIQDDSGMQMSHHHMMMEQPQRGGRGRKRGAIATPVTPRNNRSPIKRQRLSVDSTPPQMPVQPAEKPDANMCLKFTFGVNAWKQWVMTKNADIEKSSIRRRLFKTELLQMTADELNYSLCLFVKEVRKPNGTEYAPDTIYYLVLGIQQYLYENGRIDNIFTDPYYERFTDCLDEVARKFSVLYNDSQYIVTRVEEEHLWECKQLGAHSPHVLLSTLMFFNTKHFNLTNVEEHMQLSFSHIMKHWKRSAQNTKSPGTRNVLLRFYPPQAGLDANPRKKKVYEQQENEENPLRCPVRLYEFYLSKCPESVKTRNDVFYLQPERSCVPDSPVWYSTQALGEENLQKMLHRVKMVKEINIALLTS